MNHAVIFAGGVGSRMGDTRCPKQFLKIDGKEIIVHTIDVFQQHSEIDMIHVACHVDWLDYMSQLVDKFNLGKVVSIVPGGSSGQLSIYNGLLAAKSRSDGPSDIVLIHDGVRPLIDSALISANIRSVLEKGSAVSGSPATETILHIEDGAVVKIADRSECFYARAPQSFFLNDILRCHEKAMAEGFSTFIDSCSLVHYYGLPLNMVPCSSENIKVTTPKDYYLVKALLEYKMNVKVDE